MYKYKRLILSEVSVSSTRMLIGASSTIYMIISGLSLYQVGIIKSFQALIILALGFIVGLISDRMDRKYLYVLAVFFSFIWLLLSYMAGNSNGNSFELFFLAELFNALSLCVFQNNNHGYLVDTYNSQFDDNDTKKIFGKKSYLEFLFMSIASVIGGVLYQILKSDLFLLTSIMMFIVFMLGTFYLPNCKTAIENNPSSKIFDKKSFALIFEKFEFYKKSIFLFLIFSLYFQIIIQYWQIIIDIFDMVKSNESILGLVLFLMMLVQSFSGKILEKYNVFSDFYILSIFFLGLLFCIISLQIRGYLGLVLFVLGICANIFSIRYLVTATNSKIHANIPSCIRAKYDMVLNTVLRLLTASMLLLVGFISDKFGASVIVYFGLVLGAVSAFITLRVKDKNG